MLTTVFIPRLTAERRTHLQWIIELNLAQNLPPLTPYLQAMYPPTLTTLPNPAPPSSRRGIVPDEASAAAAPATVPATDQSSHSSCPAFSSNLQLRSRHSMSSLPAMRNGNPMIIKPVPISAPVPVDRKIFADPDICGLAEIEDAIAREAVLSVSGLVVEVDDAARPNPAARDTRNAFAAPVMAPIPAPHWNPRKRTCVARIVRASGCSSAYCV